MTAAGSDGQQERPPLCICTNSCPEDRADNMCPHCRALDIYEPCPIIGFGCATGLTELEAARSGCGCCSMVQRLAAAR